VLNPKENMWIFQMFIPYGKSFFTEIRFSIDIYALRAKDKKTSFYKIKIIALNQHPLPCHLQRNALQPPNNLRGPALEKWR
jgi:hypothetical protein